MPAPSRSQAIGIAAVCAVMACVALVSLLRVGATSSTPGITLKEAFPQAPAAPPPVRAADPVANLSPRPSNSSAPPASSPNPPPTTAESGSEPSAPASDGSTPVTNGAVPPTSTPVSAPVQIAVDVAGAVHKPGLYYLPAGSRNNDAIQAAGGATDKANLTAINLASRLTDGKQLYVPTRKERPQNGATDNGADTPEAANAAATATPTQAEGGAALAPAKSPHAASKAAVKKGGKSGSGKFHTPGEGTVNLNAANPEQLQRLPGVGPAMAERLIAFRKENHGFQTVEDLMQVSGIGPSRFAKMAPFCRVH